MESIILDILAELREGGAGDDDELFSRVIGNPSRKTALSAQPPSKRKVLAYYLRTRRDDPERWARWGIDAGCEKRLLAVLQVKRRRTASGVATITVITKPWKCASDCLYCPNDPRMPKSYLADEPACQRAERNHFDPYLQAASRLRALTSMGHVTDKVELIVLGGTWDDYPPDYRHWFISELFRALNDDDDEREERAQDLRRAPEGDRHRGPTRESAGRSVGEGAQATGRLTPLPPTCAAGDILRSLSSDELQRQQQRNETAARRAVGLVIETRPDTITAESLTELRRLGCTKIQMGVQSLDPAVLHANRRDISIERIREAFELLRVFGFKTHVHFMLNLYGSTPEADKRDFAHLFSDPAYRPDELKLYPCALVAGTGLVAHFKDGSWRPYTEEELLEVLTADTLATPSYARISRMVRDISAHDILAGNRKANLRQLVEQRICDAGQRAQIHEIRYREIAADEVDLATVRLEALPYETTATDEYFLQWVTPEQRIVGFLRLSLPHAGYLRRRRAELPPELGAAMIREVHVYGKVAALDATGENAQHLGLGRRLIEAACEIARERGRTRINVISAVGTREYYRGLGFQDTESGLYQQREL